MGCAGTGWSGHFDGSVRVVDSEFVAVAADVPAGLVTHLVVAVAQEWDYSSLVVLAELGSGHWIRSNLPTLGLALVRALRVLQALSSFSLPSGDNDLLLQH